MTREFFTISSGGVVNEEALKITIEGDSDMPFWNHDLKVKAILMLLESIDVQDYHEDDKSREAEESYHELLKAASVAFGYEQID